MAVNVSVQYNGAGFSPTLYCWPNVTTIGRVYFQVNNGVWSSFLDYVEGIYWSSSSPFVKSLTQTFWFYFSYIYLTPLLAFTHITCISITDATSTVLYACFH